MASIVLYNGVEIRIYKENWETITLPHDAVYKSENSIIAIKDNILHDCETLSRISFSNKILLVDYQFSHTIIYTEDGLYVKGKNHYNKFGVGGNSAAFTKVPFHHRITAIYMNKNNIFVNIFHKSCSIVSYSYGSILAVADGLYAFGKNTLNKFGKGNFADVFTKIPFSDVLDAHNDETQILIHTYDGVWYFDYGILTKMPTSPDAHCEGWKTA